MIVCTYCAERIRLDKLYARANVHLSKVLMELSRSAGSLENSGFEQAWATCEEQRHLCRQIFEQIHDHVRKRHCQ